MKKFNVGDRVLILVLNWTGTIVEIYRSIHDIERFVVQVDSQHEITYTVNDSVERKKMRWHTHADDLQHLNSSSKSEPDWKDIWDSN